MRINRSKASRRVLRLYKLLFGIESPYNVILDGNFIFTALKSKIDIVERVKRLLHEYDAELHLFVLKSVLTELKELGDKGSESLSFIRRCCREIDDSAIEGLTVSDRTIKFLKNNRDEIKNANAASAAVVAAAGTESASSSGAAAVTASTVPAVSSKHHRHYCVATQDMRLRTKLGKLAGVPLIYLNKVIMVLEPLSDHSRRNGRVSEEAKSLLSETESSIVQSIARAAPQEEEEEVVAPQQVRRKRKAAAANPLSSRPASEDSNRSKRKKADKFRR
jgi:U3 small nucleolar RNA-associated protein 23